jgi:hypothetical protein
VTALSMDLLRLMIRFQLQLENRHSRRGAGAVDQAERHGLVKSRLPAPTATGGIHSW